MSVVTLTILSRKKANKGIFYLSKLLNQTLEQENNSDQKKLTQMYFFHFGFNFSDKLNTETKPPPRHVSFI